MNSKFNKFIGSSEARLKYKKQCLKNKNILFQNDSVQIGCKILPFYDFYSSRNFLQMQIFIGNKTNKKMQRFNIQYRGSANLEVYLQEKSKIIPQNAQYKERVILDCSDYDKELLMLLDFHSQVLTLQSIPIPLTLFSFCIVTPHSMSSLPLTASYSQLLDLLTSRFQYIQQTEIMVNVGIFRKGLVKDLPKLLPTFTAHTENMCVAQFTLRDLVQEYILIFLAKDQTNLKITLAANQYTHFEAVLENLKFLLAAA